MDIRIISAAPARNPEADRLRALRALGVLDTAADPDLDAITTLAADRFDTAIALVSLVDADRQWFKSRVGLEAAETDRAVSFCARAIERDEVMVVPDARTDPRFAANPLVTGAPFIRFYAGAPLVTAQGYRIGTLCVIDPAPRETFAERDCKALAMMARQVIGHLELGMLRRSERLSHLISETTADAFICTDTESRITYWNRAAEVMFGWTAAEAMGQGLDLIIPDRHRKAHHAGLGRIVGGGPTKLVGTTVEVPALTRDGRELPIELSLGMWQGDSPGRPAGFAAVLRDISGRKRLEAERRAAEHRLSDKLAAIEASHDGIALTDPEGRYIFMNSAHAALFGFASREEPIGQPWTVIYTDAEAARIEREAFPILQRDGRYRGEATGLDRQGNPVDQEISLSLSPTGGIVCVTRDIGSRRAADRERVRLREQLLIAQRHEAVGQLAAGIAHDFNNLIATIGGSAGLILSDPAEAGRHVERIQAACSNATGLVDKMLHLGDRPREPKRIDLGATVGGVCDLLQPSLPAGHRLVAELPDTPIFGIADETELMQVVLNLGINARDALPRDRAGTIRVRMAPAAPDDAAGPLAVGDIPAGPVIRITVEDDGLGMDPAALPDIFRRFYSGKGAGGTGLGLAVVAGIVAKQGGAIAVRSEPGRGSRFDLYWPLVPGAAEPPSPGPATGTPLELAGLGILVVDDQPEVVEVLAEMLSRAGAEVGPCVEPGDALIALSEDPEAWSLVVTDFDMPGMSGAEFAGAVRRIRPDLPILLCTALPETRRTDSKAKLFDGVIRKPVAADALVRAAADAILSRRGVQGA